MKHPVDAHVGKRVRHRRWMMGMTQQQLGDMVGIKFQQIQKYETGMNRISASRLWDIAKALDVPINYFFEGLESESLSDASETEPAVAARGDLLADKEALGSPPRWKADGRRDATPGRGTRWSAGTWCLGSHPAGPCNREPGAWGALPVLSFAGGRSAATHVSRPAAATLLRRPPRPTSRHRHVAPAARRG